MFEFYFWENWVNPWIIGFNVFEVGHGHGFCVDLGPITLGVWVSRVCLDWN